MKVRGGVETNQQDRDEDYHGYISMYHGVLPHPHVISYHPGGREILNPRPVGVTCDSDKATERLGRSRYQFVLC
jgi:hypothetical protein